MTTLDFLFVDKFCGFAIIRPSYNCSSQRKELQLLFISGKCHYRGLARQNAKPYREFNNPTGFRGMRVEVGYGSVDIGFLRTYVKIRNSGLCKSEHFASTKCIAGALDRNPSESAASQFLRQVKYDPGRRNRGGTNTHASGTSTDISLVVSLFPPRVTIFAGVSQDVCINLDRLAG